MAKKKITTKEKKEKTVFVIMPFTRTNSRNKEQLTAFFENNIKSSIEKGKFSNRYIVSRSDNTFNITEKIIKDLYNADIVICDLSGPEANPNVMYELGIRLASSDKPVILIREAHPENRHIFDVGGFFAEPYDAYNYSTITKHLKTKIKSFEDGSEVYLSPVLKILEEEEPLTRV